MEIIIELGFSWDPYKDLVVKDVNIDNDSIEIIYEDQAIMFNIYGSDIISEKDVIEILRDAVLNILHVVTKNVWSIIHYNKL